MIKAAAGGGGRGIRIAQSQEELEAAIDQASAEAKAAFGDGGLYLEKFIPRARHIEVQILGDGVEAIHCFERECSLQRRRQKVWEEAPAFALTAAVREELVRLGGRARPLRRLPRRRHARISLRRAAQQFYFIEMNTRIQVEHPVTEMITGIDLVREMIRIAGGAPLQYRQQDVRLRGHAIEVRINAEDPARNFRPSPGAVTALRVPGGFGTRFDTLLYAGCVISPFYDSLVGKLVVWDESREMALSRLRRALCELIVEGISTTQSLHQRLAAAPDVLAGDFHTRWLEQWLIEDSYRTPS